MKSLKELYNLSYDESGFDSGLIRWYNKVIDKDVDALDATDVSRMIRQNILLDIAIKRTIELFFCDPYDGEYQDGDLLSLFLTLDLSRIKNNQLKEMKLFLQNLKNEYMKFNWENDEKKDQYAKELHDLETKISKLTQAK